jgi:RNA-binding protein
MLTTKQKKELKKLGHKLDPVIHIGKEKLSSSAVTNILRELENHELIKIKINDNALISPKEIIKDIEVMTSGEVVQTIGKMLLLYKANEEDPVIKL